MYSGIEALAAREPVMEATLSHRRGGPYVVALTTFETGAEELKGGMTGSGTGEGLSLESAIAAAVVDWKPAG